MKSKAALEQSFLAELGAAALGRSHGCLLLFLFALALPLTATAAPPTGPERFLQVKEWSCSWTSRVEESSSYTTIPGPGSWQNKSETLSETSGNMTLDLLDNQWAYISNTGGIWTGKGTGNGSFHHRREQTGYLPGGERSEAQGSSNCYAKIEISMKGKKGDWYDIETGCSPVPGTYETWGKGKQKSGTTERSLPSLNSMQQKLPTSGLTLAGSRVKPLGHPAANLGVATATRTGTHTNTWSCAPAGTEEYELLVEPKGDYDIWLPKGNIAKPDLPGANISFKATFQKKGGGKPQQIPEKVRFTLVDTSKEKGIALNFPKEGPGEDFDLKITPGGFVISSDRQKAEIDSPSRDRLVWDISVESFDFGAFGRLRAVAVMPGGVEVIGKFVPTSADFATIPRDDDSNHVADDWEKRMRVSGKPADSDDDPIPSGQANDGDGITLFEEYRGFVRLKGMTDEMAHERTDPRVKTLFVIDHNKLWNSADWADAAGMESFRLDNRLVAVSDSRENGKWNITNFLRGFATGQGYDYAVRLQKSDFQPGDGMMAVTDFPSMTEEQIVAAKGPRDTIWVLIFDQALKQWVDDLPRTLLYALDNRTKGIGKFIRDEQTPLINMAVSRLALDPAAREAFYQALLRKVVVHEVGHACGVDHHGMEGGLANYTNDMAMGGEVTCPTHYFAKADYLTMGILDVLFPRDGMILKNGKFCSASTCWPSLRVKEW